MRWPCSSCSTTSRASTRRCASRRPWKPGSRIARSEETRLGIKNPHYPPFTTLYNATKFGLRGFALGLRADWGPRGVGVSCVNPGPISGAGMFHDSGAALPAGVGARSPEDVAAGVVQAIVHDKAEIDVMDLAAKAVAAFGLFAPQAGARLGKLLGAQRLGKQLAEGQREKR